MSNCTNDTNTELLAETINIAVYVLIVVVGFVWNGTLLLMFVRHKEIRTTANTMIFNLAASDFINITVVAPLRYTYHYPHADPDQIDLCRCISAFHHWILNASALCVVALSIQKFCVTQPKFMFHVRFTSKHKSLYTTLYIIFIWMTSLLISLPYVVSKNVYEFLCGCDKNKYADSVMILVNFVLFCFIVPLLTFALNLATARRLKKSVNISVGRICNEGLQPARKRSANVVIALSALILLTHLPYFSWNIYAYWIDGKSLMFEYVSKHFLFLNSCFDPLALYITSDTFRQLFKRYLCFPTMVPSSNPTHNPIITIADSQC